MMGLGMIDLCYLSLLANVLFKQPWTLSFNIGTSWSYFKWNVNLINGSNSRCVTCEWLSIPEFKNSYVALLSYYYHIGSSLAQAVFELKCLEFCCEQHAPISAVRWSRWVVYSQSAAFYFGEHDQTDRDLWGSFLPLEWKVELKLSEMVGVKSTCDEEKVPS